MGRLRKYSVFQISLMITAGFFVVLFYQNCSAPGHLAAVEAQQSQSEIR